MRGFLKEKGNFYIYVLELTNSNANGNAQYYIGQTKNLRTRLIQHLIGVAAKITTDNPPVELLAVFRENTRRRSLDFESYLLAQKNISWSEGETYCSFIDLEEFMKVANY